MGGPGKWYFSAWLAVRMDNIKTWTGLPVEESVRMTEDRDEWRKYVHGVANPRIGTTKEQNRTVLRISLFVELVGGPEEWIIQSGPWSLLFLRRQESAGNMIHRSPVEAQKFSASNLVGGSSE